MFVSSLFLASLSSVFVQLAVGAPTASSNGQRGICDVSGLYVHLGEYPNQLPHPQHNPKFVYLGVGTQNYTCNGSSYGSNGALAGLIDLSCTGESEYESIAIEALSRWTAESNELNGNTFAQNGGLDGINELGGYLGEHFFMGNIPRWDFSVAGGIFEGNENAFVMGAQPAAANVPAPKDTGDSNVAWLYLTRQDGELADEVYRTDTRGGVAPQSCSGSDSIQVKYVSVYWLTGSSNPPSN
ncbi:hypothetical protein K435DRAFT_971521 [Dendrothele bispora CBS 962.96]|uniref:Malate dehydrogenase n=1 Tax=Dendrothele bispora (strain CBS 962.96) TaxID=1314807 RepID=A0A4S8L654_DENBC|nr:hypothetical protein K435DRAFT_971521 [Dendrothele bispora CBS 962.96]